MLHVPSFLPFASLVSCKESCGLIGIHDLSLARWYQSLVVVILSFLFCWFGVKWGVERLVKIKIGW